uniref:Uncharacterized protein n=1 Tax=Anopheles coluzzii TaxID=1518534 RepID=A0A6E8VC77_ANOCL|nr:myb-like protein Q [Anopheles coluzzii]
MRWQIVLLLVSVAVASGEKKLEKRPTKKAHSVKPTKTPKSILEEFTALPPADVDFIKELDRQFKEHGDKIRIKVERSNGTDGKNIKRTIDGELGYGHYSNQADTGYHFSKPKYMIYPYSQHDIPPVRSTHSTHETVTDIEITPSHSYELKPIEEVYQVYPTQQYSHEQHQHQQQQQYYQQHHSGQQPKQLFHQEDDSPVIVLKIPGPSKYAAHLQALLQQYLEIRAAQLYKELEEHEYQQQQQYEQHHHQQQQQVQHQQHYVQEQEVHAHHHHQQQQQEELQQQQQHHEHHTKTKYSQPDPVYPTEIAYVPMIRTHQNTYVPLPEQYYDAPKAPSPRPTKHRKTTVTPTHVTFHSTAAPEPAYHYQTYHPEQHAQVHEQHEQSHAPEHQQIQYQYVAQQPSGHGAEHETQYVYEKPMVNFVTPVPETPTHAHTHEEAYHQHQHHRQHQPPKKYPNFAEYHHHHMPPQQQEEEYLPEPKLVENYPSHKHTRVIYKSPSLKTELQQEALQHEHYHHQQQQQQHHEDVHHHHQQQQHQQQYILQEVYPSQASYFEDKSFVESVGPQATTDRSETASPHYNTEQVVAITQKPKRLYNYHAHSSSSGHHGSGSRGSRMAAGGSRSRSGSKASSKRDAAGSPAPYTEDEFRKVNKMVQRMKKKSRTTPADEGGMMTATAMSPTSPSPRMVA